MLTGSAWIEPWMAQEWPSIAFRGVMGVIIGTLAVTMPAAALMALVWLFGGYALLDGVFNLTGTWSASGRRPRWVRIASGLAGVAAGMMSFVWPGITALALVYIIAAWALITGGFTMAAAVALRKDIKGEWLLGLGGLWSIVLGIALAAFPAAGALGLVWYFGLYAIVSGLLMLALSYRLRARIDAHKKPIRRLAA